MHSWVPPGIPLRYLGTWCLWLFSRFGENVKCIVWIRNVSYFVLFIYWYVFSIHIPCMYMHTSLSICPSTHVSVYPSVHISDYIYNSFSIFFIWSLLDFLSVYLFINIYISLIIFFSILLSTKLFIYLFSLTI